MSSPQGRWVSSAKYHSLQDALSSEFFSWLRGLGAAIEENPPVSIALSQFGRALVASRHIPAGSRLLEVPRRAIITPDKIPREVESLLTTDNSKTRLALVLLAEKHKGHESTWAPYIQCLPRLGGVESTIFWAKDELAWLEDSIAHRETTQRLKVITSEYDTLEPVLSDFPHIFGKVSLTDFMHAYASVTSRAWGDQQQVSSMSMVPFADFLNHDHDCRTRLYFDNTRNCAVAVADRDYAPGEEVFINYGCSSNAILAVDYGFAVPSNPFEQVKLWMEIPPTDPLRETKLEFLSRHNMPTDSGCKSFTLRDMKSRDKTRMSPLFAFSRVICARTVEDLEEMIDESISNDAFYAMSSRKDESKEAEAMSFVSALVQDRIDVHRKALETVGTSSASSRARKQIAQDVLHGELGVLESVLVMCQTKTT